LFERLDRPAFEKALRQWVGGRKESCGWREISIDGKELRGTQGHEVAGVRVLAAYAHEARLVLDQIPVDAKTNEHGSTELAEVKTALELLDLIPLKGTLVSGDAMFCQRDLSRKILKKRGLAVAGLRRAQSSREREPAGVAGRDLRRI
jgi:hypothetical protein